MKNLPAFEPAAVERVCAAFIDRGETVADWARAHGFEPPQVYAVLAGRNKGRFGRGHQIAVALGLKAESTKRQQPSGNPEGELGKLGTSSSPPPAGNDLKQAVAVSDNAARSERGHA